VDLSPRAKLGKNSEGAVIERELPEKLNVLVITQTNEAVERIRAVAPDRLNVAHAFQDFLPEMAAQWPERVMVRNGWQRPSRLEGQATPEVFRAPDETEALVREAQAMLLTVPFPKTLPTRAPNLIYAHFSFAGVSNLFDCDWWNIPAIVTSSRGATQALPIAEMAMGAALMLARRLDLAVLNTKAGMTNYGTPKQKLMAGKTMGIVGLGGIGAHIARLAKAFDMRVIATRHSATERRENADGVDLVLPASGLHELMAESDFIAVCLAWTPETQRVLNKEAFAAAKPGAYLLNVARGEVIDEPALVEALHSGQIGGAYLDVWWDDFGSPPRPELLAAPNLILTPHISGVTDAAHAFFVDIFCENLGRLLRGEPLQNVVDWNRGY
jgi:phosphoglycerate dehydrogenase-like enzyme